MITDLISLQDAFALAGQIPDQFDADGAKRQAQAIEIVRQRSDSGDSWRIQIPRTRQFVLPNGDKVSQGMAGHNHDLSQVASATVVIGNYRIPVILAQAILGAYFVALERGDIIPTPLSAP